METSKRERFAPIPARAPRRRERARQRSYLPDVLAPRLPIPHIPDAVPPDELGAGEQVGAVPFRWRKGELRVLLVTSRTTKRWICPKGGRMRGLTDRQAAAIEAREEAGVEGYVYPTPLGRYAHVSHDGVRPVVLYPLEVLRTKDKWPEMKQRRRKWMSLPEAVGLADPGLAVVLAHLPGAVV